MPRKPSVVVVMSRADPDRQAILEHLEKLDITLDEADNRRKACRLIQEKQSHMDAVITGVSLPDGNWCDVLNCVVKSGSLAKVYVCSATADERLWSEVIWRGAVDLLVEPLDVQRLLKALGAVDRRGAEA